MKTMKTQHKLDPVKLITKNDGYYLEVHTQHQHYFRKHINKTQAEVDYKLTEEKVRKFT